jgi:hypothetical protein
MPLVPFTLPYTIPHADTFVGAATRLLFPLILIAGCHAANERSHELADSTEDLSAATHGASGSSDTAATSREGATAAVAVVKAYYDAINARDYPRAYRLWESDGRASGLSFDTFRQGFAETARVELTASDPGRVEGAAGSRYVVVPVEIVATQRDGTVRRFGGRYTLRRSVVPGTNNPDWHLYTATLRPI